MLSAALLFLSCRSEPAATSPGTREPLREIVTQGRGAAPHPSPNILLVVLDDVGAERVEAYGSPYQAPKTETLSALARDGVLFTRAWSNPLCSPTRATLLTGRYSRRTRIGRIVDSWNDEPELELSEVTLPELLARAPAPYTSAAAGKWHLGSLRSGPEHPLRQGFSSFEGPMGNLRDTYAGQRSEEWGYFRYMKNENGRVREATSYVTTETADDAIEQLSTLREPWLVYLAFNAAHFPLHTPPEGLGLPGVSDTSPDPDRYDSALVALDRELGRVIASIPDDKRDHTYIFVVADNGTPEFAIRPPLDPEQAKGSLMELGVHVPLLVTGPGVPAGQRSSALVNTVDVFATAAQIAGVPADLLPEGVDGISFLPSLRDPKAPSARRLLFAEKFDHNGPGPYERVTVAVSDERFKLLVDRKRKGTVESLYDVRESDGFVDGRDLLAGRPTEIALAERDRLTAELARIESSFSP